MKKLSFITMALPALCIIAILSLGSAQKPVSEVSFSITAAVSGNVNTGSFTSTGLALSSGQFSESYAFNGKKTHSEVVFQYSNGTITAKTHCEVSFTGPSSATGLGTFIIVRGTGDYIGIKGDGTVSFVVSGVGTTSESITQEWSGNLK
jgi:hypothetical protein